MLAPPFNWIFKMLTKEQKELVEKNIGLAYFFVKKRSVPQHLADDVLQSAFEALCKSAMTYDASKAKFSTYVAPNIKWTINEMLNKDNIHKYCCLEVYLRRNQQNEVGNYRVPYLIPSRDEPDGMDESEVPYQAFHGQEELYLREEAREEIRAELFRVVNEVADGDDAKRERYMAIIENYLSDDPKTLKELASEWGISKQRMSHLWVKLSNKLASEAPGLAEYIHTPSVNALDIY